jgi:cation transport ATPase
VTAGAPTRGVECLGRADPDELLRVAASLDQVSPHVLAGPILRAASERGLSLSFPKQVVEEPGAGIRGRIDDREVALGKASWVLNGHPAPSSLRRLQRRLKMEGASGVFVAIDGRLVGALILEDPVRSDGQAFLPRSHPGCHSGLPAVVQGPKIRRAEHDIKASGKRSVSCCLMLL